MNRLPGSRFRKGLSSGLSILTLFAVEYSLGGSLLTVAASDGPSDVNARPTRPNTDESSSASKILSPVKGISVVTPAALNVPGSAISTRPAAPMSERNQIKGYEGRTPTDAEQKDARDFHATAYCLKGRTASGEFTKPGMIAADPRVLPLGTIVHIRAGKYTGTYTVMDTGTRIKGQVVDVYLPSYQEARRFGRQAIKLRVVGRAGKNAAAPRVVASARVAN